MKKPWFIKFGWTKYPVSWEGWLIALSMLAFMLTVFMAVDKNTHSVSDTLYEIFPYAVPTFLLYDWIARRVSKD